jgi:hypothetical protein
MIGCLPVYGTILITMEDEALMIEKMRHDVHWIKISQSQQLEARKSKERN